MKKLNHYVYVYLNPLKPGKFEYFENGIGISFGYEPFYIGEGRKDRMYHHLKEAKKHNSKDSNKHKINTIRQILKNNLEPIIYKIFEFENEQDALNVERILGFLIGRYDQKRGPLTNLVDCGGKPGNLSSESKKMGVKRRLKTLENNPDIMKKAAEKRKETEIKNPDIMIKRGQNISKSWELKTEEEKNKRELKRQETIFNKYGVLNISNVPEIIQKSNEKKKNKSQEDKLKIKEKNNTAWSNKTLEQKQHHISSRKDTCFNLYGDYNYINIEKSLETKLNNIDQNGLNSFQRQVIKSRQTKIDNRSQVGKNNHQYILLDIKFLINCYFNIMPIKHIINLYNKEHTIFIGIASYKKFLKILNFPSNVLIHKNKKEVYLKFVEENKHKIDWYIENYERLEEEYFEIKFKKRLLNGEI